MITQSLLGSEMHRGWDTIHFPQEESQDVYVENQFRSASASYQQLIEQRDALQLDQYTAPEQIEALEREIENAIQVLESYAKMYPHLESALPKRANLPTPFEAAIAEYCNLREQWTQLMSDPERELWRIEQLQRTLDCKHQLLEEYAEANPDLRSQLPEKQDFEMAQKQSLMNATEQRYRNLQQQLHVLQSNGQGDDDTAIFVQREMADLREYLQECAQARPELEVQIPEESV